MARPESPRPRRARKGFLHYVRQRDAKGHRRGDRAGGAVGHDGSGLPTGAPNSFMFATGIECSDPTIAHGKIRRDLLEECGHYTHWKEDFALVAGLGIKVLRYGLSYHRTHRGPGRYDFSFADVALRELRRLHITPILDLLHFGVPSWLGDFQNPELPVHFADYAAAVARRYPWVRFYTPVNEIFISARMSARDGLWNEQLKSDRAFVTALKHLVAASTLATHAICSLRPDAVFVQSESAEYVHDASPTPSPRLALENKLRFVALDLLYAHPPDADVLLYLLDNGLTREEYAWKMRGEPPGYQVMGNDYYGRNEKIRTPGGQLIVSEDVAGWYQITRAFYERYRKPLFHTETNTLSAERNVAWLWKQWVNVLRLRADGVPVLGFTWYSLIDQIDWDIALARVEGHVNPCGLYDLQRRPRPVAAAYRELLEAFGQLSLVPRGELFELSGRPARLNTDR